MHAGACVTCRLHTQHLIHQLHANILTYTSTTVENQGCYCSVQEWWQWEKATVVEKHQLRKCLTSESSPKQMQTNQKHEKALNKLPKSNFLELLTIKWLCKLIKPSVSVQGVHSPIVLAIAHSDNRELVGWGKGAVKALWSWAGTGPTEENDWLNHNIWPPVWFYYRT